MKFALGQPATRIEDQALLTGGGRYTDDFAVPGMVWGHVLRSPIAHGTIRGIDRAAALRMPGVLAVLTGAEVAADGLGDMPCVAPLKSRDGAPRHETPRPLLAIGKVRHVGQAVAFIIAETREAARDAAEAVVLDIAELPAIADTGTALAPGAPQLYEHIADNVVFDWDNELCDPQATAAAFAKAAHVTRLSLVNNRVVANAMEPRGALADYDAASGRSTLYTHTQGVHMHRDMFANAVLHVPREKLRVVTGNVGGSFGAKGLPYPEQALVVWASRRVKRPVKWLSDRSEGFLSDHQGRDHVTEAELALDEEGRFLGVRVRTIANLGAYLSPFGPMVPTRSSDMIAGLYRTPSFDINVKGVVTNTVTVCAYRGAGRPEAAYLMERLVDTAARELGLGPDEIRRRNFIPAAAMPFTTGTKVTYDSGDFAAIMERAMAAADWAGFPARSAASKARGRLCGRGMATYTERCGGGFPDAARIEFKDDRIELLMGAQEIGTGLLTSFTQVLADRLGVDAAKVAVIMGDTDRVPNGMTGGSRAASVSGSAIRGASDKVIAKGRQIAAHLLEAAEADIDYADATFRIAGTDRSIGLFEVARAAGDPARLPPGMEPGLDVEHTHMPAANTFPNGCHIVEVEIDPETGAASVERYTIVDDFGAVLNPLTLEGQVQGGIVQGLGQALCEETVYDPGSGQLLSGSFADYCMPRADTVPSFAFSMLNVPTPANPLGMKGAGEAGTVGAAPAVMNAIVDALDRAAGIRHIDMPATPRRIWEALQEARRRAA